MEATRNFLVDILNQYVEELEQRGQSVDVISLNETKIRAELAALTYSSLSKFSFVSQERSSRSGGGVAVLVRRELSYTEIAIGTDSDEIVGVAIRVNAEDVAVFSWYNRPDKTLNGDLLSDLTRAYPQLIICGDLNARSALIGCTGDNSSVKVLAEKLEQLDLISLNAHLGHTYIHPTRPYSELLDHVPVSARCAGREVSTELLRDNAFHSDHVPVLTKLSYNKIVRAESSCLAASRNYSRANWLLFKHTLDKSCVSAEHMASLTIDELLDLIHFKIRTAAELAIPRVRKRNIKLLPARIVKIIKDKRAARRNLYKLLDRASTDSCCSLVRQVYEAKTVVKDLAARVKTAIRE